MEPTSILAPQQNDKSFSAVLTTTWLSYFFELIQNSCYN